MKALRFCVLAIISIILLPSVGMGALEIKNPSVQPVQFNPSKGESVQVTYALASEARIRIRSYSPDDVLVRTILNWDARSAGKHAETWDGKDDRGVVIPDEAYYFTIEAKAGKGVVSAYDPAKVSGGDELEMTDLKYDSKTGEMIFSLAKPSRIMVRAGLADGPLMKTPIDWMPFDKGTQRVTWDGKDESGVVEVGERSDLKLYGIGYALPNCTVVTTGNSLLGYQDYLAALPKTIFRKPYVAPSVRKVPISPFWGRPPCYSRAIRFTLRKPEIVGSKLKTAITIAPDDVELLRGVAYEIIVYVDKVLLLDDERGHTPYALSLDLSKVPSGQHTLVVNLASVTDRIGARSTLFTVVDDKTPGK